MADNFNPQEIVKIAINVEANGEKLYRTLESKAKDEKLRSVWKYLGEQEAVHRQFFQDMLDNIGEYIVHEFNPGEYQAYLRAIASEYIFTQGLISENIGKEFSDPFEAVDFAIFVEKESVLTYSALREYMSSGKQAVLDKVIEEEKKHLVDLITLKSELKKEE